MGGTDPPKGWKGGIVGIDYKLGDVELDEFKGWEVSVEVNNYQASRKTPNVIGYITGAIEPDRYVFLSNHRDAWGYGSVDPSSGTAQLMEVARALGNRLKTGWI